MVGLLERLAKKCSQSFLKDSMNAIQQSLNQKCGDAASSRRQKLERELFESRDLTQKSLCSSSDED